MMKSNSIESDKMNLQDHFPYNATLIGLNDIYYPIGEDAFYINSRCILAKDQIVSKNRTYILELYESFQRKEISSVYLLDVFYFNGYVYLLIMNIETDKISLLDIMMNNNINGGKWDLIDDDFFNYFPK